MALNGIPRRDAVRDGAATGGEYETIPDPGYLVPVVHTDGTYVVPDPALPTVKTHYTTLPVKNKPVTPTVPPQTLPTAPPQTLPTAPHHTATGSYKNRQILLFVLIIIIVVLCGVLGYMIYRVLAQDKDISRLTEQVNKLDPDSTTLDPTATTTDSTATYVFKSYSQNPSFILGNPIYNPAGAAVHPKTRDIYVIHRGFTPALCRYSNKGSFFSCISAWRTSNGTAVSLYYPYSITITSDDRFIITGQHRVLVIQDGTVTRIWGTRNQTGTNPGQFYFPTGTAVDQSGKMYVVDLVNDRIQILDQSTDEINLLGPNQISGSPTAVAINPVNGDILVVMLLRYVLVFNNRGEFQKNVTLSYLSYGMVVDNGGYVYITDYDNGVVHIYSPSWAEVQTLGKPGSCDGCFNKPIRLAIDNYNGNLIVTDSRNNRVQVFTNNVNTSLF